MRQHFMAVNWYMLADHDAAVEAAAIQLEHDAELVYALVGTRAQWLRTALLVWLLHIIALGFGYTLGAYWF